MKLRTFDADNHYYETLEAFTRHLDPAFTWRGPHPVRDERGHVQLLVGGRLNRFVPNPTFDPIVVPGCLDAFFRGQVPEGIDPTKLVQVEPLRTEYQDRSSRLAVMSEQGLDAVVLFPTLACGLEQALKDDVPATMASLSAFNRWLDEEWGYCFEDKIFAAPMLSFADPEVAVAEAELVIERGARIVHVRPAPVPSASGPSRSLGDKRHDPVWARLAEAEVAVGFHLGDSGYNTFAAAWGASSSFEGYGKNDLLSRVVVSDRAIHDTIASLLLHGVFKRHPTLKVASIENGSDWLHLLVKRLRKQWNQAPRGFVEDPLETLRRHLWLTPYCEEDLGALGDLIGTSRILFGSDWPHGEGLAQPLEFLDVIAGFSDQEKRQVMGENAAQLLGLPSVVKHVT
jgi:predicted TIM-barrel fold metal-dependent hydrolase